MEVSTIVVAFMKTKTRFVTIRSGTRFVTITSGAVFCLGEIGLEGGLVGATRREIIIVECAFNG